MTASNKRKRLLMPAVGILLFCVIGGFWYVAQQDFPAQPEWTSEEISHEALLPAVAQ